MGLVCISLMTADDEHIFMSVGLLYILFGEVPIRSLPIFLSWIIWILGVEFYKFFKNFGY